MKYFLWDAKKNEQLKRERKVSFEQVVFHIERGDLLDILEHPDQAQYPNHRLFVLRIDRYSYVVPFVENSEYVYLKTIFPSRKLTAWYKLKEKCDE
ncbi:MAG: toxin [candidate division Zixibacteria bacterium]|nr:toxin [candidate division Zixibacteria bacterium]